MCLRRGQTHLHHSRETTSQALLLEGLTHNLPLPPAARGEPLGLRVPHRCSQGLRGPSWKMKKARFLFLALALPCGIWGYSYLARNHRNKNKLMKPRESEFLHGRRPNATGCVKTHPKWTLGLQLSSVTEGHMLQRPPPPAETTAPTPEDTELTASTTVWKMCFSFLFLGYYFQKALCDQNRWPWGRDGQRNVGLQPRWGREPDQSKQWSVSACFHKDADKAGWTRVERKDRKEAWGPHRPHFRMVDRGPCMQSSAHWITRHTHTHTLPSPPPHHFLRWDVNLPSKPVEITSRCHTVWNGGCFCVFVAQSCSTLCDPMDFSPPGFSIHRIFPWQKYWSGLPFLSPGIKPGSPTLQAGSLSSEPPGKPRKWKLLQLK